MSITRFRMPARIQQQQQDLRDFLRYREHMIHIIRDDGADIPNSVIHQVIGALECHIDCATDILVDEIECAVTQYAADAVKDATGMYPVIMEHT